MDDRQLIADLLSALEYHTEQTRPIEFSKVAIQAAREYLQKPAQQEPVAWEQFYPDIGKPQIAINPETVGYVAPQRKWVGLTKEEIAEFDTWHDHREEEIGWCNPSEIVAYIEAKLKDKNT